MPRWKSGPRKICPIFLRDRLDAARFAVAGHHSQVRGHWGNITVVCPVWKTYFNRILPRNDRYRPLTCSPLIWFTGWRPDATAHITTPKNLSRRGMVWSYYCSPCNKWFANSENTSGSEKKRIWCRIKKKVSKRWISTKKACSNVKRKCLHLLCTHYREFRWKINKSKWL